MKKYSIFITAAVVALMVSMTSIGIYHFSQQRDYELRSHYYRSEVATLESPHGVRMGIAKGEEDFILVDIRSQQEYEDGHIIGALNVPAYINPEISVYSEANRISNDFVKIKEKYPNKQIIIYCYSTSCMSGRKIGSMLTTQGFYVKELSIGWNEWRNDWNMWNYPTEWETTDVKNYIHSGKNPGVYKGYDSFSGGCSLSKDFDC